MFGLDQLYVFHFLWIVIAAINDSQRYTLFDTLEGNTTLATVKLLSRVRCAFHCMEQNGAGFSYDVLTRECQIFKATLTNQSGQMTQGKSSNIYGKIDECKITPFLGEERRKYTTEHPFMKDNSLTRYRCTNFTDTETVNSCPVSRCDKEWSPASLSCTEKDKLKSNKSYEGRVTCTLNGVTCQRWDSSTPHRPLYLKGRTDLHNLCQTIDSIRPWCYTTDPAKRWDYCPVEEDTCDEPPSIIIPGISITIEWPFNDAPSLARYRCATYVATETNTSCPVATCLSDRSWLTPNISCSEKDCFDPITKIYDGRVSCTWTGITCQRWDSDYPHRPSINRGRSDLGNRCVIDVREKPWCYTVDPSVNWSWCPVDECV